MKRIENIRKRWEKIAALYGKLGTQEAVGKKLGVSKQAVSAVLKKARAIGVDVPTPVRKRKPRPPVPDNGMCRRHPRRKRVFGSPYCRFCKEQRASRDRAYRAKRALQT